MPRELFNSVNQEKKNRIYLAAKKEFTHYPYEEVSLNRIISSANISRGSFYLYFENKQDLYYYTLSESRNIILNNLERSLLCNHTLFEIAEELYEFLISFISTDDYLFFERVFENFTPAIFDFFTINIKNNHSRFNHKNLGDYELFDAKTPQDLTAMIELVIQVTLYIVADVYFKRISIENGRANLKKKLAILKKAYYK